SQRRQDIALAARELAAVDRGAGGVHRGHAAPVPVGADQDAPRQLRDRRRGAEPRAGAAAEADRGGPEGGGEGARPRRRAVDGGPATGVEGEVTERLLGLATNRLRCEWDAAG